MIFPDSWAYGQPPGYEIEQVSCPRCGEDRWPDRPCEHCGHPEPEEES
jgi:hypothetical protein